MKKKNSILLSLLSAVTILGGCSADGFVPPVITVRTETVQGSFDAAPGYVLCAEQGDLSLYVDPSTTNFYVENRADGSTWHSSPAEAENDLYADGTYRMEMLSTLVVSYAEGKSQLEGRFNTYTGSVMDNDFTIRKIHNGFRVDYHFAEVQATIPLRVYLADGGLQAEVLVNEIQEQNEDIHLCDIAVLPFFGAGGPRSQEGTENSFDEGYLFVADGSGGLIHFNNGRYTSAGYNRPVFGRDAAEVLDSYDLSLDGQNIAMPVFGIRRNASAFLAVIENGAAISSLRAYTNMQQTSYANVYSEFSYHGVLDYSLGNVRAPVYEKGETKTPSFSVKYIFLAGEEADYNGMARTYRSYLMEKYRLTEQDSVEPALYLELFGGVSKTVSRLGIQYKTTTSLTNTAQVREIADLMKSKGVENLVISYRNWNTDDLAEKSIHSGAVAGSLEKEVKMTDLLSSGDFAFYPALYDLTTFTKGSLFKRQFHTATDISGVTVRANKYAPGIGTALDEPYYLITARDIPAEMQKTFSALNKKNILRVSLSDLGNQLYNDYRDGNVRRENIQLLVEDALDKYGKSFSVLFNCPNSYALPYAAEVFSAPTATSGQDLLDEEVPFYNMVISGLKRYSAAPFNNSAVGDDSFLKALETGSMPSYTWIYENTALVMNTDLSFLSSSNYLTYVDKAAEQYQVMAEIAEKSGNGKIRSHRKVADSVYCLTYETGLEVYVNYGTEDYVLSSGGRVNARSYLLKERGE